MAGETLLAIASAFCIFAAATAVPILEDDVDRDLHPNQLAVREDSGLGAVLNYSDWLNATHVLEQIDEVLSIVEDKIKEVTAEVQTAAQAALDDAEKAALEVTDGLSADVQRRADAAARAGVDVQDCLNRRPSLADVAAAIRNDTQQCAGASLKALTQALEDVRAVAPLAKKVVADAKAEVEQCRREADRVPEGLCLLAAVAAIQTEAAEVLAKATLRAAKAAAKAAAITPVATMCACRVGEGHAAEASAVARAAVRCIKDKLVAAGGGAGVA